MLHTREAALPAFTRSMATAIKSERIGDLSPGPKYDSRRPGEWLEDIKLHLRILGIYGLGTGEDLANATTDAGRMAHLRRCGQYCGIVEKSLGTSISIIVPDRAHREDPVRLWNAIVAYVERRTHAGTSTWSLLHHLFTKKYKMDERDVHTHLARLLSVRDRIVRSDPEFSFPDKLMVAAILLSVPTHPGSIFESVYANLTMELSKPGSTVDTAMVINQLEQRELTAGEHYDGQQPKFKVNHAAMMSFSRRDRSSGERAKCDFCNQGHHIYHCDRLFRQMLWAHSLIREPTKAAATAMVARLVATNDGCSTDDGGEGQPTALLASARRRRPATPGPSRPPPLPAPASHDECTNFFEHPDNQVPGNRFFGFNYTSEESS
mmetsp:Transcript_36102/g.52882  ORF Transcript_36102/g.52882 Transcript_36102/m.52882 type:complete len:378 (-) Transcript_36102:593-1726(-)